MTIRIRKGILPFAIASLLAAPAVMAQNVTSSAVTGVVVNAQGQPVSGATVKIVNVPSGTTRVVTTDTSGRYNAKGLRVGGPYDITVSKAGLVQSERDKIYLQLGQTSAINLIMEPSTANATKLGAVTVTANALTRIFSPANKGVSTNISERQLDAMPTPGRSIQDVVRMDPMVNIVGRSEGKISALGQNYRYNNITVDSISANDPFGLNANGLPTTGTPISQNAIAGYNISVANYDVTNRRGLGANINAVVKSGTNHFHGSVYYVFEDHNWIGDNAKGKPFNGFDRDWTAGATLGGPIIKNKLFFFINYEKSDQVGAGTTYGPEGSNAPQTVNDLTQQELQSIRKIAAGYGLKNIGVFEGGHNDLVDKRYLAKIDWNINNNHRVSFTWRRTLENQPEVFNGDSNSLTLSSGWIIKNTDSRSYALHFYDDWSNSFSTKTTVSYAHYYRVGGPYNGVAMPSITVNASPTINKNDYKAPTVEFGTDYSYQANLIDTRTLFASWIGNWFVGNHTLKFGIDFERNDKDNLFLQDHYGEYQFDSIPDFKNGDYYRYYYARPADSLTLNDVSALFSTKQWGVFLQDTWQVNDNLSLQYGFRVDKPQIETKPVFNPKFAAAGFTTPTGQVLTTNQYTGSDQPIFQPRASFNYSFNTQRLMQLRGGFGLFITQPPAVWIGNIYTNTGNNVVSYECGSNKDCNSGNTKFSPDPHAQNNGVPGSGQETVNTLNPGFHIPEAWKFSLGYDVELPWWGLIGTVNYVHVKTRYGIWYQAVNTGKPTGTLPDGRSTFYSKPYTHPSVGKYYQPTYVPGQYVAAHDNYAFSNLGTINLANTDKGKDDSLTLELRKPFNHNWSWMVATTWNHATDVNPGLSSVAESSYKQQFLVNPSANVAATSNYNMPFRAIASIEWRHAFFGHYYTRVSAFWVGHDGHPYSWTFGNDANGDGFQNDLVYIPKKGGVEFRKGTSPALIKSFWAYVNSNQYLKDHQGEIAARNADRAPFFSQMDVSFSQEIPGLFSGNKGEIRLDIYNFLNIFNSHWGVEHRADFPGRRDLADYWGVDTKTHKYIYDITGSEYVGDNGKYHPQEVPVYSDYITGDRDERWAVQLTVKYTF